MLLNGKVALVTGGGRGIGRATALAFAREGADVAIAARTESELRTVADEMAPFGRSVMYHVVDLSLAESAAPLIDAVISRFGRLDILVNNAAITYSKPLLETTLEEWEGVMNTNLRSVFLLTKEAAKRMIAQGSGRIINIASGAGLRGLPGDAPYAASKAGVVTFTYSVAGELFATGVRANVICPGPIRTRQLAESSVRDFVLRPGQTMMEPEEVAGAALFLASDLSGNMNGQAINVRTASRW